MWTPHGVNIVTVLQAEAFIYDFIEKIKQFVSLHLIPELLHEKLRIEASVSENNCLLMCSCERPLFGKLV